MTAEREIAATVNVHDCTAGSGSVLLDDGHVLTYGADAFRRSGLRLLRAGQRVHLRVSGGGPSGVIVVSAITIATFDLP